VRQSSEPAAIPLEQYYRSTPQLEGAVEQGVAGQAARAMVEWQTSPSKLSLLSIR